MPISAQRAQLIEDMQFKHGPRQGKLVAVMDILSDIQIGAGTHAAYCKSPGNGDEPSRDIQELMQHVDDAKQLIRALIEEGRESSSA
jgi:hypothetical protein